MDILANDGCHKHRALPADETATTVHAADDGHDARGINVGVKGFLWSHTVSSAARIAQLLLTGMPPRPFRSTLLRSETWYPPVAGWCGLHIWVDQRWSTRAKQTRSAVNAGSTCCTSRVVSRNYYGPQIILSRPRAAWCNARAVCCSLACAQQMLQQRLVWQLVILRSVTACDSQLGTAQELAHHCLDRYHLRLAADWAAGQGSIFRAVD